MNIDLIHQMISNFRSKATAEEQVEVLQYFGCDPHKSITMDTKPERRIEIFRWMMDDLIVARMIDCISKLVIIRCINYFRFNATAKEKNEALQGRRMSFDKLMDICMQDLDEE